MEGRRRLDGYNIGSVLRTTGDAEGKSMFENCVLSAL